MSEYETNKGAAGGTARGVTGDTEVSTTELASVLGVTARRVQQMAQDGTIQTVKRGRFLLGDSVQRYITFVSKPEVDAEDAKLDRLRRQSEVTMKASRAQIAKLEMQELQGKMHRSEDVAAMTEDLVYAIRSMLVALPGRLAVDTSSAASSAEAAEIIRKEVFQVMNELSRYRYDSKKYEERVRERRSWDAMGGRDDDDD